MLSEARKAAFLCKSQPERGNFVTHVDEGGKVARSVQARSARHAVQGTAEEACEEVAHKCLPAARHKYPPAKNFADYDEHQKWEEVVRLPYVRGRGAASGAARARRVLRARIPGGSAR